MKKPRPDAIFKTRIVLFFPWRTSLCRSFSKRLIFFRTVSTKSLLLCLPNEHPVCLVSLRRQSRNSVEQITRLMPLSPRFHSKRGYFCLAVAAAAGVSNGIQLFRIAGLSNTGTERGTTRGRHL